MAFHCPELAKQVIDVDPFGVLRYGETSTLGTENAVHLFNALEKLAEVDPYFRSQDWGSHPMAGLMIPALQSRIESAIGSAKSNSHWRAMLIEGLRNTELAGALDVTLESIILSVGRFYTERKSACSALMPYRSNQFWSNLIVQLHDQGAENSTRLARSVIEDCDFIVDSQIIVATIFAEMGVIVCAFPRRDEYRTHTIRLYSKLIRRLTAEILGDVLDLVVDYVDLINSSDWQSLADVAALTAEIIERVIVEKAPGVEDPARIWKWLGVLQRALRFDLNPRGQLRALLDTDESLRHALQRHALYVARARGTIWMAEIDLRYRLVGLAGRPHDVAFFLEEMAHYNNSDPMLRADWCDLMRLGLGPQGIDSVVLSAGAKFQKDDQQLIAFVRKLQRSRSKIWGRRAERRAEKQRRKDQFNRELRFRNYFGRRAALAQGNFNAIVQPAKVYLGRIRLPSSEKLSPIERLEDYLGNELALVAIEGFEAVLGHNDLPSPRIVSQSFAENMEWNYCYAIMAGLLARQRANRSFGDVPVDVRIIGLLSCYQNYCTPVDDDISELTVALENSLFNGSFGREDFARLWLEPSIDAKIDYVPGLYKLANDLEWLDTGIRVAFDFLINETSLPLNVELQLVDCLSNPRGLDLLTEVANARASFTFLSKRHMFAWIAIDVLVRFDSVCSDIEDIGARFPDFIWELRDRLQFQRSGNMLPINLRQAYWIISQFRRHWPQEYRVGADGDRNGFDASELIRSLMNKIGEDTSQDAISLMHRLAGDPEDTYTDLLRHIAAEQRQKLAEKTFLPVWPNAINDIFSDGPPSDINGLRALVLEELAIAQKILDGDDLDQVRDFWNDSGIPYDENRCRDRLASLITPELRNYGIQRMTEVDMPCTKRADLAFARGDLQLPMEVKGQWHPNVWHAATEQLSAKYLADWRSRGHGIYCVLWFGDLPSASGRRLKVPPDGLVTPSSAAEMSKTIKTLIPEELRTSIDVVVLDLSMGNRK